MDMSYPIYLITEFRQEDEYGVAHAIKSKRMVYANVKSVGQREFYEGGRAGLNPEFVMTMFAYDYASEQTLEYMGRTFDIYRTYQKGPDEVELYCSRKQGKR